MTQKLPNRKLKICIVTISLGRGGAERSNALLSRMLTQKGHDVSLVVLNDSIDYPFEGSLFNLGKLKTTPDTMTKRLARFKKLRAYFKKEKFDYILDSRNRSQAAKELFYLHYLYKDQRIIYVAHSFKIDEYFTKQRWLTDKMIKKAEAIVGVSKAIAQKINFDYVTDKAVAIYNPMQELSQTAKNTAFEEKYVLFLGRIQENVKNFSLLLEAYKRSQLPENNIHLKLVGDGPDRSMVQQKVDALGLSEKVRMYPFTADVYTYLKNAVYLVLTSHYEGFPMVLIEALSVGTPVVSVACNSGPGEIVIDGENGLLVENYNEEALAAAMDRLAFDVTLLTYCKNNAQKSIAHLHMDQIAEQWNSLLNKLHT